MDKIPTLFLRDPENMRLVTREVNPDAAWVLEGYGIPTAKKDGMNIRVTTACGECVHVEKRRNPTREEKANGAEPGYVDALRDNPADKHIFAAVDATDFTSWPDSEWSCEALGPKIQGGVESGTPTLYAFIRSPILFPTDDRPPRSYEGLRDWFAHHALEGIVWHDRELRRMAKIKRRDFGLSWPVKK